MTAQRFAVATIAGGVTVFLLGYVTSMVFAGLMSNFSVTPPDSYMKDSPVMLPVVLGSLATGALLTVLLGCWTGHTDVWQSFRTSAILGAFISLYLGLSLFGMTTMLDFTGTLIKIIIDTIQVALAGMVVGAALGRDRQA